MDHGAAGARSEGEIDPDTVRGAEAGAFTYDHRDHSGAENRADVVADSDARLTNEDERPKTKFWAECFAQLSQ